MPRKYRPRQRTVEILGRVRQWRGVEGLSYVEIGKRLGITRQRVNQLCLEYGITCPVELRGGPRPYRIPHETVVLIPPSPEAIARRAEELQSYWQSPTPSSTRAA